MKKILIKLYKKMCITVTSNSKILKYATAKIIYKSSIFLFTIRENSNLLYHGTIIYKYSTKQQMHVFHNLLLFRGPDDLQSYLCST